MTQFKTHAELMMYWYERIKNWPDAKGKPAIDVVASILIDPEFSQLSLHGQFLVGLLIQSMMVKR